MSANTSSRTTGWEWLQTALLVANLVWTTLCLGGSLPETQVVTGGLTSALVGAHLLARAVSTVRWVPFHPAGWVMVPFLAYAAANVCWITPVPWRGWQDWFLWAQVGAVFWVVVNGIRAPATRSTLFITLLTLGVANVLLACYQRFVDFDWLMLGRTQALQFVGRASGSFGIPNSLSAFLLLLIPPCIGLAVRRRADGPMRVFFGWLAGVLLLGLVLTISRGGLFAIGLAFAVWPLFSRRWRLRRRIAVAVGVVVVASSAIALLYWKAPRVRERLTILARDAGELTRPIMWRAAWNIFVANPAFGKGAGSYAFEFEKHRPEGFRDAADWAHNEYLNTLSDYGVVGFALCFGGVGAIAWLTIRAPRDARASSARLRPSVGGTIPERAPFIDDPSLPTAIGIGLLAFALQLAVDFHFKIPALGLAAAALGGLAVRSRWLAADAARRDAVAAENPRLLRIGCAVAAIFVVAGSVVWNIPRLRAEGLRYAWREQLDRLAQRNATSEEKAALAEEARSALSAALALDPKNADAWADRAYASAILAREDRQRERELGIEAEHDARRAIACADTVWEFWLRLGVGLDMQGRWNDAGLAINEGLKLAPLSATAWYYHAYHLSLNPVTHPLAKAAVATCLRLDPSLREGDSLRQHLDAGR